jgi:hypothetical protein
LVVSAATVVNSNPAWGMLSTGVTFVVRDRMGHELARHTTRVAVPPDESARVVAPEMMVQPKNATVDRVDLVLDPAKWTPAGSFITPTLTVDGAGFSSEGDGDLTAVASISNTGARRMSAELVCVLEDAAGGLTGAAAGQVSLGPGKGRLVRLPVKEPAAGTRQAQCEIVARGR